MAQVLLLKINSDGLPNEHSSSADDVTFQSITATDGPVVSATGILLAASDALTLTDATGSVEFQVATDTAGELDQLVLPSIAGTPTATPTSGEASTVWDSSNDTLYIWDGAAWISNFATASSVPAVIDMTTFTAGVSIVATDAVYISAANSVDRADANLGSSASPIGFAPSSAAGGSMVNVQFNGIVSGFSGLAAGARYFLSEVAGGITLGVPTTSAAEVIQVGYAPSASQLLVSFNHIGVRA